VKSHKALVAGYLVFVERCYGRDIPPIFDDGHLASLIGLPESVLRVMVGKTGGFYRSFFIPKRSGGQRQIDAPIPHLLLCQRWILENVLSRSKIHDAAHGGVAKRSAVTNARVHAGAHSILKLDIKDFFPSTTTARGIGVFRRFGYPTNVSSTLAFLCFHNGALPQGGACSTAISNSVLYRLDVRLWKLSAKLGLSYTRYVDDLTFSGEHISVGFAELVKKIVASEGYLINQGKTRLMRGSSPKYVTGVSLSSGAPRVPRSYRRAVRNEAFQILKRGLETHMDHIEKYDPLTLERVIGRLAYWRMVEPDCQSAKDLFDNILSYARSLNMETADTDSTAG
jgi:RNA-directed DNA polymerase